MSSTTGPWWRSAVIYQVYIRSFADGNGDGVGDIAGIRSRLPYLKSLGVDALWINPWYKSPMADHGYDVADYREIDPLFGTVAEAELLIEEAHAHGIRIVPDIVPNHSSDQHAWFQVALAAGPGSPERERYIFRPGRGPDGALPPSDWDSRFGGPAWTRVADGEWYLHLFTPQQPDLNWQHPDVHAEFESVLRFWFERGVDGFRIDVAHGLVKDPELPDLAKTRHDQGHPFWDRDEVHDIYRAWRKVADEYLGDRAFVAEAWTDTPERLAAYLRPDGLHTAFNFDFLMTDWNAKDLRAVIDDTFAMLGTVGAPATWVMSSHDVMRHASRYGRKAARKWVANESYVPAGPADLDLGTRRARAAALLTLALPGGAYVYQGEELGLPEVEDLPEAVLQDPVWDRSGHTDRGRDGCRVPIPWSGQTAPYGFSPGDATAAPWLPQPADWAPRTVEAQAGDETSMLELYRAALRLRHEHPALGDGTLTWLAAPAGVLAFRREPGFVCVVNLSTEPYQLPEPTSVLLTSGPIENHLAPDQAAWLAV
ncbi:glycoside hydrolase family 13 protein (plasmid) [Streptomyces sp. NBC_01005]|uniref:glycoside hydrolase family 13 protein n=1 Tax=unclassified Streptomyces TaxID=2593676 RepID=UPI002F916657|nr:glycoside hydrolase family 13 protein [Streptomyces sp. NBC_01005]WTD00797.1 glycoside hydrolase family 13 protein [Streptomyces sp. NBC_01650]